MKWICGIFLIAAACLASDFTTGQAARLVIGQTSFTAADPNSSNTVIGAASGVAYAADTLFSSPMPTASAPCPTTTAC